MDKERQISLIIKLFSYRVLSTLVAFGGLLLFFAFFTPRHLFVSSRNLELLSKLAPDLGIVALGVGLLMICGEFDLSISSILPFCSYVFVLLLKGGVNLIFIPFITIATGALLGFLNGVLTVKGGIPSFIATLGTMMFWRGVLYVFSKMSPIAIRLYLKSDSFFVHIFTGKLAGIIPVQIVWFIGIGIFLGILLHFHRFGNWVYATGDNKEAARAMGINTDMVKIICFIIVGILCAFVAMIQIIRVGSFSSRVGQGWELKAVAASVVGGTSLMGGIGSMVGIFCGTFIIIVIENALTMLRISYSWTYVVFGLVIISSVLVNFYMEKRRLRYGSKVSEESSSG